MRLRSTRLLDRGSPRKSHRKVSDAASSRKPTKKQPRSNRKVSGSEIANPQDSTDNTNEKDDKNPYLYFWKPDAPNGWASQWHYEPFKGPSKLLEEGVQDDSVVEIEYPTAETWMMYHKAVLFEDAAIAEEILATTDPKKTRALGRRISNFDEEIWEMKRYDIVLAGNIAKFKASEECKKNLLATGNKILVEASPSDRNWGIGFTAKNAPANQSKWGLNLLGRVLVEVRETLRQESSTKLGPNVAENPTVAVNN
ncbi:hypothetical protein FRB93_011802 [Tulasnella sp. JGI-2019a]|nr:hypothetical protein FRB93_011802 [Tulasnella sp. JGI-2019a]